MFYLIYRFYLLVIVVAGAQFGSVQFAGAEPYGFDSPDSVPLGGLVRQDIFNSPLGPLNLRWTREVEKKFGRTPLRATMDAATAVSRVLRLSAIPTALQNPFIDLRIAFMDTLQENAKFPRFLFDNCHPGWMVPPSNVYIVGERIYSGCGGDRLGKEVAEELLSGVVVHELAHVIEYSFFGTVAIGDRARREGFARWFELLASRNSSLLSEKDIKDKIFTNAERSFKRYDTKSFVFDGSAESYDRMASYFAWLEYRYGLAEVFVVYEDIKKEPKSFLEALENRYKLSRESLNREVYGFVMSQIK